MEIILYISIPSIIVLFFLLKSAPPPGSDHAIHVSIISRIKLNRHRFVKEHLFSLNEKHVFYPQFYHWALSFLPVKTYKEKHNYIGVSVKLFEIIAFNFFLLFLYNRMHFDEVVFLYANIVVNVFPFSYSVWNAKNTGISARGIGLVAGQIYIYFVVAYILTGNLLLLVPLFAIVFIIMLMSQMAMQFILLTLPFFLLVFKTPELSILPFLSFGLFYLIMPQLARDYVIGQYNHKRNYALFLAEIFILKERYSIWRDFVYDFWVKLKTEANKFKLFYYISKNPIVEVIYGMPFLWFILYCFISGHSSGNIYFLILFKIVLCAFIVFFLTTFRKTRFLGEPQRYLEFTIPLIATIFALTFSIHIIILLSSMSLFLISVYIYFYKKTNVLQSQNNKYLVLSEAIILQYRNCNLIASNDSEQLKYFSGVGFNILYPDISTYYKSKKAFQQFCHNQDFNIISPYAIEKYVKEYNPELFILNKAFYSLNELVKEIPDFLKGYKLDSSFYSYDVYVKL